ncbi:MAG TPA: tetratricopeptide repeat protein [Terriglobales bacterium]|jgi:tetratricopeptide (TPR) repeat protein|nr:tetratricopeptide repeat protein [Terriglobales bacterium]
MRLERWLLVIVWVVLLSVSSFAQSSSAQAAKTNYNDPDRQQGMQLYKDHKLPEAAALLEKVVARYPEDMVAHEALGSSLLSRAATWIDPAKRKADRLHARAELLRAKELGDNSDLCKTLLDGIPEDGSESSFSSNQEVEAAMQRAEAAFARGEFEDAIAGYSQALALDPKLYYAALDIGDSYFRLKKTGQAGEWFAKAIQIEPNEETAYRYWGDALMADGQMKAARAKFIEGLVANPYRQTSWNGLNNWVSQNHVSYKEIPIQLPAAPAMDSKGNTKITVDPATMGKNDGGAAWMTYPMERALWRNEKFAKEFPQEKTYRHSLKEEISALSLVATVFEEIQQKKKLENPDPSLVLLSRMKSQGMLEPFVLLVHPDTGVVQDYPAYRAAHREKLIQFVDEYVLPQAP